MASLLSRKEPGVFSSLSYQVRHLTMSEPLNGYNLRYFSLFYFQVELIIILIAIMIVNIMIWLLLEVDQVVLLALRKVIN